MWIQVELVTPLGKYLSRREECDETEYEHSITGIKQAAEGHIGNFHMSLADGDADDDLIILGKDLLIQSLFRVIVER